MKKDSNNLEKKIRKEWKNLFFNIIFAFVGVFSAALLHNNVWITFGILLIVSLAALIKWNSRTTIFIFIFGAFWGPISEMICIAFGAWQYSNANFYSIPIWLFLVWGDAAAFLYQTALEIKKLGVKDN
jgi:uncharacterized Tic20 family protein